MKTRWVTLLLATLLSGGALNAAVVSNSVQLTQIGAPKWRPMDFRFFTAPIGTPQDGFSNFWQSVSQVLPPPNHAFIPQIGVGPGTAHLAPYDTEIASGLTSAGFRQGTAFTTSEFSFPNAVFFCWMNVPTTNAPTGSSPDFANGPIIPNTMMPLRQTGITTRNGTVFDSNWDGDTISLNSLVQPFNVDGYSHSFNFNAEAAEFGPTNTPPVGVYQHQFSLIDTNGNGWQITANFDVSDRDFAVTSIKAPKTISLTAAKSSQTKFVTVTIQNRSPHDETITNLNGLVTLQVRSLTNSCPDLTPVLFTSSPQKALPLVLRSKASLKLFFAVTYSKDCMPDALKNLPFAPHMDYSYTAHVDHSALGTGGDIHSGDDDCPRNPLGVDPNPDGTISDIGCGGKTSNGALGAPVLTDVIAK